MDKINSPFVTRVPEQPRMREPQTLTPAQQHRKDTRAHLECETCGQLSRLKEGMCPECVEKYQPEMI